ncbi:TRAP transporter small permease subunit [Szabonella alba]|uniref:TRAP transporter small permease protein n=1 Tax=Szabonella alba TaxID=2804194 RepID=A0A8K0VAP9_9RHOB|nr:TRAP transporter small permease [Szabonella alba]
MILLRFIDGACRALIGVAILVMVFSIFGQVFYRVALDSFLGWAEEVARFSFVWLVFIGSVSAFWGRNHLGIDFLPELLGPRGRVILDTVICAIVLVFCIVLARYGYTLTLRTMTQTAPATGIVMGYVYMAMPLGAALTALFAAVDFLRNLSALWQGDLSRAAIQPQQAGVVEAALREDGQ